MKYEEDLGLDRADSTEVPLTGALEEVEAFFWNLRFKSVEKRSVCGANRLWNAAGDDEEGEGVPITY